MFCTQCGLENSDNAHFCQNCGHSLTEVVLQVPSNSSTSIPANNAIWNPNATANWSLILTPAFGSYLQMLNWLALGEAKKAATARMWFYISLGMLLVYILRRLIVADHSFEPARPLMFVYLFVWYFANGRTQAKYVKEIFGSSYLKKSWGKALLLGVVALIGYALIGSIIVTILERYADM